MEEENRIQQQEEVEALSSIYGSEWKREPDSESSYSIQITKDIQLFVSFTNKYPSTVPPHFQLLAPTLSGREKEMVQKSFHSIYEENLGSPVVFQWIEKLKEIVGEQNPDIRSDDVNDQVVIETIGTRDCSKYDVFHGSVIQDRKSTFQAHVCSVQSQQDINSIMDCLLQNKKIAQATHNISAYRIKLPTGGLLQDCDDDGETHAGGRLLHLLQILDVTNVMVVVTRWYGGVHLGPDRFRHINNAARQALQEAKFIK